MTFRKGKKDEWPFVKECNIEKEKIMCKNELKIIIKGNYVQKAKIKEEILWKQKL